MSDYQTDLSAQAPAFINEALKANADFHIGVFNQVKGKYNAGLVSFNAIVGDPGTGCNNNSVSADDALCF